MLEIFCSIVLVFFCFLCILLLLEIPEVSLSKLMSTDLSGSTLHSPEAISQVSSLS